jgi:O-antigen ligase
MSEDAMLPRPGLLGLQRTWPVQRFQAWLRSSTRLTNLVLAGVSLIAFTTPLRQVIRFQGLGTITRIVGLAVFPLAAIDVLRRRSMRPLLEVHGIILAFVGWAALSMFWSIEPGRSSRQLWTLAQLAALVWLVWEFARDRPQMSWVLASFVAGAYIVAFAILVEFVSDPTGPSRYSSAPGIQPNGVAFLLGLAIPIAWYLGYIARPRWLKIVLRLYVLPAVLASLLTGSRSALFTTAAGLSIIPLTLGRMTRKGKAAVALGLLLGLPALLAIFPSAPVQRLLTTPGEIRGGDFHNRRVLWNAAMTAFDERPVTGVGVGAARVRVRQLTGREDGPHNSFISVAADLGVVGLALFCLILLAIGRMIVLSDGLHRQLGIVLFGTLLLGLLPRHWEYDKPTWLVFGLVIGVAAFSSAQTYDGTAGTGSWRLD